MNTRTLARRLLPPSAIATLRMVEDLLARTTPYKPPRIRCVGDYDSWDAAVAASQGYDDPLILDRTRAAVRKVVAGEAAFERDSVTFEKAEYRYPLLWTLYRATLRYGRLHVIDFGGALGSTYYQHRALLPKTDLHWAVVEQPQHVALGAAEFATPELTFHDSIEAARQHGQFDALLLSGVLQCLPDPYDFFDQVAHIGFETLILDRVPFMHDGTTRLTIQHVPDTIYAASYPAWFLSEAQLLRCSSERYDVVARWPALDAIEPEGARAYHCGFLLERK